MNNHDTTYGNLLDSILINGDWTENRTGTDTIGLYGYQMRFDLSGSFPLLTSKKLPLRWIFEELRWFLSGSVDVRDLQAAGVDIWDEWATEGHNGRHGREWWNMGPIYSHQWRNFGASPILLKGTHTHDTNAIISEIGRKSVGYNLDGFDQISWLQDQFNKRSNSRRLILSGWNPIEANMVALPPCHTFSQWSVYPKQDENDVGPEYALDCHLYQRSGDVFLGVPFNIASYALLTIMFARATGLKPGCLIHTIHDAHLYENHVDQAREQLDRIHVGVPDSPTLSIMEKSNVWDYVWSDIHLVNYTPMGKISAEVAV